MLNHLKDRWLVGQFLLFRSESAFNQIYQAHASSLFKIALQFSGGDSFAAEELVQETWIRAVQKLDSFRWESAFRTWLVGILIFCGKEYLRKSRRYELLNEQLSEYHLEKEIVQQMDIESALDKLPMGYKTVLVLHDIEGYKHEEISKLLGIQQGTSKSQLFHARRMIRNHLNYQ